MVSNHDQMPPSSAHSDSTPADVAALVMVRRLLKQTPDLADKVNHCGVAVVVEVPGPQWVDPVAEAWRELVLMTEDVPEDADDFDIESGSDPTERWLEVRRDGLQRAHTPREGNGTIALALSSGRAVYGFAPTPDRHLPASLVQAADIRATIPRLDADAIHEIIAILTGATPNGKFPSDLARLVEIDDFWLSCRRGESADDGLRRLQRLVETRFRPPSITLNELHGMDEASRWGTALSRDLAEYREGTLPWSAIDRGVVVYGPPGTGKTTFAQALAGSCGVPLIAASLNQWQSAGSGHLGDLLKAMAETFQAARAAAPAILFVDEVDSFGDRASFKAESKDYSIQVVNAFLEHLDGIGGREGVVVVGACNHPDRLDPAIVRSGRLDRMIAIPLPDCGALANILRHHLAGDLRDDCLAQVAKRAQGATGADCARWVRGARRRARSDGRPMSLLDLEAEICGTETPPPQDWLYRFALHEAGHAIAILHDRPGDLTLVTIRQSPQTGGGTLASDDHRRPITPSEVTSNLILFLAGRAAEDVILGSVSAGAGGSESSDLARATALATAASTAWGLSEDGLLWQGMPDTSTIGSMLALRPDLARQVRGRLADAYTSAKKLVVQHRHLLERIAARLVEDETLDGAEIRALAAESGLESTIENIP